MNLSVRLPRFIYTSMLIVGLSFSADIYAPPVPGAGPDISPIFTAIGNFLSTIPPIDQAAMSSVFNALSGMVTTNAPIIANSAIEAVRAAVPTFCQQAIRVAGDTLYTFNKSLLSHAIANPKLVGSLMSSFFGTGLIWGGLKFCYRYGIGIFEPDAKPKAVINKQAPAHGIPLDLIEDLLEDTNTSKFSDLIFPKELQKDLDSIYKTLVISKNNDTFFKAQLFTGLPGLGKTEWIKAVAKDLEQKGVIDAAYQVDIGKLVNLPDGPNILSKIFKLALEEKALLFFDELDGALPNRMSGEASSENARKILTSILQPTGSIKPTDPFSYALFAATNVPGALDDAILSRFDLVEFTLPDVDTIQKIITKIFKAKKFNVPQALIEKIATICKQYNCSCRDIGTFLTKFTYNFLLERKEARKHGRVVNPNDVFKESFRLFIRGQALRQKYSTIKPVSDDPRLADMFGKKPSEEPAKENSKPEKQGGEEVVSPDKPVAQEKPEGGDKSAPEKPAADEQSADGKKPEAPQKPAPENKPDAPKPAAIKSEAKKDKESGPKQGSKKPAEPEIVVEEEKPLASKPGVVARPVIQKRYTMSDNPLIDGISKFVSTLTQDRKPAEPQKPAVGNKSAANGKPVSQKGKPAPAKAPEQQNLSAQKPLVKKVVAKASLDRDREKNETFAQGYKEPAKNSGISAIKLATLKAKAGQGKTGVPGRPMPSGLVPPVK